MPPISAVCLPICESDFPRVAICPWYSEKRSVFDGQYRIACRSYDAVVVLCTDSDHSVTARANNASTLLRFVADIEAVTTGRYLLCHWSMEHLARTCKSKTDRSGERSVND